MNLLSLKCELIFKLKVIQRETKCLNFESGFCVFYRSGCKMLFLLRVFDSCDYLWILFCRAFEYFAFTLVAILSESDGDSQSLEAWLLRFLEFMSIDCDSLTSLLLSTLFVSWSETWVEVRDVSFVISCCASGTDNGWSWFCIIPSWLKYI